jgi:hypothetical protein
LALGASRDQADQALANGIVRFVKDATFAQRRESREMTPKAQPRPRDVGLTR